MDFTQIIFLAIILAISIGLHEYAHAYVSYRFGDPTPKLQGRLTPNPLKHIDPIGFIMIFIIHFGRGKPVQINPMYYKNPLKGELLVALAGPATNLVLATVGILISLIYAKFAGFDTPLLILRQPDVIINFWLLFSGINFALAIFNMIPIYPLDGYRLIKIFSPAAGHWMEKNGFILSIIFLILIIGPGSSLVGNFIGTVSDGLFRIIFIFFSNIFY